MRKAWMSFFLILIVLLFGELDHIAMLAFANAIPDYNSYFAEETFFSNSHSIFFLEDNETELVFGCDYFLLPGTELDGYKTNGIAIESNKLYLVNLKEKYIIKQFSDVSISETNIYKPPYRVRRDGVYAIANRSTLLRISEDGEKCETIFNASNGKEIKDFLIVENLVWVFSDGVIYRIYLPDGTIEPVLCGIDENAFRDFLSPISNYKISWCEYAPEYWAIAEQEGFKRNQHTHGIDVDRYDNFLITHSDLPTWVLYCCDLKTGKNSHMDFYPTRTETAANTDWWELSENVQPQRYRCLGDVDGDEIVSAGDARLVLRQSVGLEQLNEEAVIYADYDKDGNINASDARMILRTSVLLEPQILQKTLFSESQPLSTFIEEMQEKWLNWYLEAVSFADIESNMKWLVNEIGVRSWWNFSQNDAGERIYEHLQTYGYSTAYCKKIDFWHEGILGRNVMATIPTTKELPDILLITAHYDTARGTSGAVDNASGTAALLQLAKVFKAANQDFGVELRFLFTAGEEQGYYGAYAYLNSMANDEIKRHIFVFNLDMAGKPNDLYEPGRLYYLTISTEPVSTDGYNAPAASTNIGSIAIDQTKEILGNLGEDGYYSPVRAGKHDIVPFRKAGIEALTLSWRCISSARSNGSDYNLSPPSCIHTTDDNIYYFDMISLYQITRLSAGAIARLILPYTKCAYFL